MQELEICDCGRNKAENACRCLFCWATETSAFLTRASIADDIREHPAEYSGAYDVVIRGMPGSADFVYADARFTPDKRIALQPYQGPGREAYIRKAAWYMPVYAAPVVSKDRSTEYAAPVVSKDRSTEYYAFEKLLRVFGNESTFFGSCKECVNHAGRCPHIVKADELQAQLLKKFETLLEKSR